jgi:hypothetical protein
METLEGKPLEVSEELEEKHSLKNAMFVSFLFVGGGIVSFWLLLFTFYSSRA